MRTDSGRRTARRSGRRCRAHPAAARPYSSRRRLCKKRAWPGLWHPRLLPTGAAMDRTAPHARGRGAARDRQGPVARHRPRQGVQLVARHPPRLPGDAERHRLALRPGHRGRLHRGGPGDGRRPANPRAAAAGRGRHRAGLPDLVAHGGARPLRGAGLPQPHRDLGRRARRTGAPCSPFPSATPAPPTASSPSTAAGRTGRFSFDRDLRLLTLAAGMLATRIRLHQLENPGPAREPRRRAAGGAGGAALPGRHRRQPALPGGAGDGGPGGAEPRHRLPPRRERDRQGGGGARHPRPQPPRRAPLRGGELRGPPGEPRRERALRPRARRLHRRHRRRTRGASSWPTAARSSSTRWASCRSRRR